MHPLRPLAASLLLALAGSAAAWAQPSVGGISPNAFPVRSTAAALPAAGGGDFGLRIVTDAASSASCTVGGGSTRLLCLDAGASWSPVGSGAGGGAPTDAEYVVAALNGTLSAERLLGNGTNTTVTTGAGTVQIDVSGTLPDARVDGAGEADELVLAGDVDGAGNANDLDETAVRDELEAVLRHDSLVGYSANRHVDHTAVSVSPGVGLTGGGDISATRTLGFDFSDAGADPSLGAEECRFSSEGASAGGLVCEGSTANAFELRLRVADPTAERTVTIPDESGTLCTTGSVCTGYSASVHSHTAAGDVDGDLGALVLDAAAVEPGLEALLDLADLQGAVTDAQVPNSITVDLAAAANALASNPANCSAGEWAGGIAASGAAEGCTADDDAPDSDGEVPNDITIATSADIATAGKVQGGSLTVGSAACLTVSSDRWYHDTDCDAVKDAGEEYLDFTAGSGVGGSTGSNDNAIIAADGAGGSTVQARDVTISDVSGSSVTMATTVGNAFAIAATAPAATTGASQAGKAASLTASAAVASTDTAGAAAGGNARVEAGAAARLTSGNANGGDVELEPGAGTGTGTAGFVTTTRAYRGGGGSTTVPTYGGTVAAGASGMGLTAEGGGASLLSGGTQRLRCSNSICSMSVGSGFGTGVSNSDITFGRAAVGSMYFRAGNFSAGGDAQGTTRVLRNSTTNATPAELWLDGSSTRMTIASDSTWTFSCLVTARRTDADNESAGYRLEGVIDNNAGTTALVGTVTTTVYAEDTAAWDVAATADNTNDALVLTVTGEASKTIRWVGVCSSVETTG